MSEIAPELGTCPFCDEDEHIRLVCGGGQCPHCGMPLGQWYVVCDSCGGSTGLCKSMEIAIDMWNNAKRKKAE